jgi:hypothetical protein
MPREERSILETFVTLLTLFAPRPPYHQTLMMAAHGSIPTQPAVAIVVAFMACEIATELVISVAFKARSIEDLEEAVTNFMNGNSLTNDRNRKLYVALTGDAVHEQPFWADLKECASWRNSSVHSGARISREQAAKACDTMVRVINHLEGVRKRREDGLPTTPSQP